MHETWTLDELTTRMRAILDVLVAQGVDAAKANGQVGEVLSARTVRYYTTIGLLDRPAQKGRTALYGRRHLEQLIAIKRLQAQGKVLADIEQQLVGMDDATLARLAAIPADVVEGAVHGPAEKPAEPTRRERDFWAAEIAEIAEPAAPVVTAMAGATGVTGIQLADGVTLAFPAARPVDDDDTKALRAALEGVVELMRARGLLKDPKGD